ncbi:hemerythrin domain-containing protein [Nonomuraea sp. NPDC048882]|uniref:hemerythrin domain-containing protein n=1 Tax=unclassified Nonomuraea TaxID=2593643 RepID=UPI000B1C54D8
MDKPDLTGIQIIHRAMRADLHRLAELTADIEAGRERADQDRAAATAKFVQDVCHAIHTHHTREDDLVWPLIERHAGAAVDLSDLSEDHSELDPLLEEVQAAARTFAAGGEVTALAAAVKRLTALLDEHIEAEEATIFPVIRQYVPAADWDDVEQAMAKGKLNELRLEICWVAQYATRDELAHIRASAGPVVPVLMALLRPGHRRRRRAVFGSAG